VVHAGHLVAEHDRQRRRIVAVDDVQVGVADAAGDDVDQLTARAGVGLGVGDVEPQFGADSGQHDGAHQ
jgi:hypothetical protein